MCRFLYFGQGENIDHIIPMLCRTKMLVKAYKLSHTISPNGLNGRYFSFTGNAPWQFHELSERDTDFSSTLLHKQGQELRSEQTVINIHEQNPSTYFCVLTIRKHLLNLSGRGPSICYRRPFCRLKAPLGLSLLRCASQTRSMRFERSGRGQEQSRGHKFSILENFLSIRDFTSQTLASFPSDLVGACLPQTLPSNNKVHNCSMDWV